MDQELLKAIREMIKEELEPVKNRLDEHTDILKALMHSSEVNAAHRDKMANDIAHMKGDITHIKGEVTGIKNEITELRADMNQVEIVTSRNWNAIARIKAVNND